MTCLHPATQRDCASEGFMPSSDWLCCAGFQTLSGPLHSGEPLELHPAVTLPSIALPRFLCSSQIPNARSLFNVSIRWRPIVDQSCPMLRKASCCLLQLSWLAIFSWLLSIVCRLELPSVASAKEVAGLLQLPWLPIFSWLLSVD